MSWVRKFSWVCKISLMQSPGSGLSMRARASNSCSDASAIEGVVTANGSSGSRWDCQTYGWNAMLHACPCDEAPGDAQGGNPLHFFDVCVLLPLKLSVDQSSRPCDLKRHSSRKSRNVRYGTRTRRPPPPPSRSARQGWSEHVDGFHRRSAAQASMCGNALLVTSL